MDVAGTAVIAHGTLTWGGHTVACPACGASAGLQLRVYQWTAWDAGEIADVACPGGHTFSHPLVYPAMVYALFSRAADGGDLTGENGAEALAAIGWRPHRRMDSDLIPPDNITMVTYLPR